MFVYNVCSCSQVVQDLTWLRERKLFLETAYFVRLTDGVLVRDLLPLSGVQLSVEDVPRCPVTACSTVGQGVQRWVHKKGSV